MTEANETTAPQVRRSMLFPLGALGGWLLLGVGYAGWSKIGVPIGLALLIIATIVVGVIEIMVLIGVCLDFRDRDKSPGFAGLATLAASAICLVAAGYLVVRAIAVA